MNEQFWESLHNGTVYNVRGEIIWAYQQDGQIKSVPKHNSVKFDKWNFRKLTPAEFSDTLADFGETIEGF